ncbi:hypothetical protein EVAR_54470_1 [Eumeta japonica]|uniref:Uncharacterized protein n=1 Tax=Eumeta variegata TaxID=151549 RepID=A0A4C1YV52_EUMVA|nr:hypothetical protein EVAR_54470_1 [Eumeta japonica]
MSDLWMRRRRSGGAQRSILKAVWARNIFAKIHLHALPSAEVSTHIRGWAPPGSIQGEFDPRTGVVAQRIVLAPFQTPPAQRRPPSAVVASPHFSDHVTYPKSTAVLSKVHLVQLVLGNWPGKHRW